MGGPILLVEDSQDDALLTLRAFRKNNLQNEIVVASDGEQALDWLFRTGAWAGRPFQLPEVVVLDLQLPKVDGLEVLRRIRSHELMRILPVVILTSSSDQRDQIEGHRLGINAYVRKPVEFAEFTAAVCQLQLGWLLTRVSTPQAPHQLAEAR